VSVAYCAHQAGREDAHGRERYVKYFVSAKCVMVPATLACLQVLPLVAPEFGPKLGALQLHE
jgi:hypothetical protein